MRIRGRVLSADGTPLRDAKVQFEINQRSTNGRHTRIGLRRVPTTGTLSKRGKKWWQWDNGDPITYANWLPNAFFSESLDANKRDYAVMTLSDGKWYGVSPDSVIWDITEMAILEKADVLDNPSAAERQ